MAKKFLLLILALLSVPVILFSACDTPTVCGGDPQPPEDNISVSFEPEYELDKDITVKISVAIQEHWKADSYDDENFKFVIGYSLEFPELTTAEYTALLTITDFSTDKYSYTKENGKYNYNFTEQFTIDKEIFGDDSQTSGKFYLFLCWKSLYKDSISFSMCYTVNYEKTENALICSIPKKAN